MRRKHLAFVTCVSAAVVAGYCFAQAATSQHAGEDKIRLFEIRTYTTEPGKLEALNARFRDHTTKLFEKHDMTNIGYWTPAEEPRSEDTLIYVLAHESRAAADKSWQAFRTDPGWLKARGESEATGPIVKKVESVFVTPTDYSALQ
jgi:NIPSNAP